ncbi:helix-turn-helix domain-containing protein [Leucobacter komagatae]|uniref:helix-turn-helix domain-containing protein n=1 Tax=Leucobacter komagatae TaxID=55969 RepID=UPI0018DE4D4C|nr:helix-turn-helix domain-containing protein [Leucobacter komagatae]
MIGNDTVLPAVTLPPVRLSEAMLYAVLRGSAAVTVGGSAHTVSAGSGLWVPAGELVGVTPASGAIVLPVPAGGSGQTLPALVRVPEHGNAGLLHAFAHALGHLDGIRSPTQLEVRGASPEPLPAPPPPRDEALRAIVELLASAPGLGLAAAVEAAAPGWSPRTVQRRFQAETGWTLTAWARRQRIRIGAELISDGRDLEWVANRVGYESLAAFTRAFAEATGLTPGQGRAGSSAACMYETLAELGRQPGQADGARRTWTRVNGAHVAVWSAIGCAELVVGGRTLALGAGEAVVIPAGTPNEFRIPVGTLLMPLGYRSAMTGPVGAPLRPARIGGVEQPGMLEAILATYTRIGVVDVDPDRGFAAVLAGSERAAVTPESELLGRAANRFAREPELGLPAAAARLGTSERELCAAVASQTGEQFAAWLRLLRMTRARNQLGDGETPTEISRELGYAHLPAFSRAFRAVHGAGPTVLGVPNLRPTRAAWGREMRVPASAL